MAKKSSTIALAAPTAIETASSAASQPAKVHFDAWWAMREKKIPRHHYKEIVQADFRARGLSAAETLADYDEALKKYGIKLN